jgi:MFS transporter, DHA1 family, multidrug resistance protein
MNIFLPSLPGMATYFGVPYGVMQQSVALYLGRLRLLQIIIGPISDRYGRRAVLLWSLVLFLIATVGTLLAPTATWFLIFRMAAGRHRRRHGPQPRRRARHGGRCQAASMIGYVTMGMSLVPMIGPVIGGVLDEAYGWQANFACS